MNFTGRVGRKTPSSGSGLTTSPIQGQKQESLAAILFSITISGWTDSKINTSTGAAPPAEVLSKPTFMARPPCWPKATHYSSPAPSAISKALFPNFEVTASIKPSSATLQRTLFLESDPHRLTWESEPPGPTCIAAATGFAIRPRVCFWSEPV